jgi:hypothetical protein
VQSTERGAPESSRSNGPRLVSGSHRFPSRTTYKEVDSSESKRPAAPLVTIPNLMAEMSSRYRQAKAQQDPPQPEIRCGVAHGCESDDQVSLQRRSPLQDDSIQFLGATDPLKFKVPTTDGGFDDKDTSAINGRAGDPSRPVPGHHSSSFRKRCLWRNRARELICVCQAKSRVSAKDEPPVLPAKHSVTRFAIVSAHQHSSMATVTTTPSSESSFIMERIEI